MGTAGISERLSGRVTTLYAIATKPAPRVKRATADSSATRHTVFTRGLATLSGLVFGTLHTVAIAQSPTTASQTRLWVQITVAIIVLLAIAFVIVWRLRVGALLRRTEELEERVKQRTEALHLATEELHFLAFHDELTALVNRRGFWQHADKLEMEARNSGAVYGLVIVDLDHFKAVNDRYGHRMGDDVLRHAAGLIQRTSRERDFVCRYGGEEFAILMVDTNPDDLRAYAEKLRVAFEQHPFARRERHIALTVSAGVSYWLGGKDNLEAMFGRADRAMYEAKETRNTCMMWNPAMDYDTDQESA